MAKTPKPLAGRVYGAARQAMERHDCPACKRKAGQVCKGVPSIAHPEGLEWPPSKVHAARARLFADE